MKLRWSRTFHTWMLTWGGYRCIVGVTGLDRPSLFWHIRVKYLYFRCWLQERGDTS